MPRRVSIRELLLRLVLAVALPLAALQAWHLYGDYQESSRRAHEQVFSLAQAAASQTATFLGQAHNVLNGLAERPAVRSLDAARCDPILHDFLGLAPRFSNIATMTMDGRVVLSFGANDTTLEHGRQRLSLDATLHHLRAIVHDARRHYLTLLVGPPPVAEAAHNARIVALCHAMAAVAQELGVLYLLVCERLVQAQTWVQEAAQSDGAQPRQGGYAALAALVQAWPAWWFAAAP